MSHILVVDDEPQVRLMISTCLRDAGYSVYEASDGEEALSINARQGIDLMIIDLIMPGKEGLETLMALQRETGPRPRVIAISGGLRGTGADFLPAAQKLGADLTLKKPFRTDALVEAVESLLVFD